MKIEKIWFQNITSTLHNGVTDRRHQQQSQYRQQQNQQNPKDQHTEEQVQKAIDDLNQNEQFRDSGLHVELRKRGAGQLIIAINKLDGSLIRLVSPNEFMNMNQQAITTGAQGSLIDQKL